MAIAENPWRYKWRATSHHMLIDTKPIGYQKLQEEIVL